MAVTTEQKAAVLKKFQRSNLDTGSPEVQIALLTARITEMSEHFKVHKKDYHGIRGLMKAVTQRRKLLAYLKNKNAAKYEEVLKELDLRK